MTYYENASLITDSYAKAYYLWKLEGWLDLNQDIECELRAEYGEKGVIDIGKYAWEVSGWF